jgi:hypothetical protein
MVSSVEITPVPLGMFWVPGRDIAHAGWADLVTQLPGGRHIRRSKSD